MNNRGKIILVEDSQFDYEFVKMALEDTSFSGELVWFQSGREFLNSLKAQTIPQDVYFVLMDLKMPQLTGLETLAEMAVMKPFPSPVILFSSSKQAPDIRQSYQLGASGYIGKPIEFEEFARAISSVWRYWGELDEISRYRVDEPGLMA